MKPGVVVCALAVGLAAGLGTGLGLGRRPPSADRATGISIGPTIHQIRELGSLVTLEASVVDIHVTELKGRTGSLRVVLLVKGDVQVASDLDQARFDEVDQASRTAVLNLPAPVASRARLDHERSRVYAIDTAGLWQIVPGSAREAEVVTAALREAQRLVSEAVGREDLDAAARRRTEEVVGRFCDALGWQVKVRWEQPTG